VPAADVVATRKALLTIIENLARDESEADKRMPSTQQVARFKRASVRKRA
jgi:hypothetical protein